ncbi:uncharacterized protein PV09_00933 [Verruconis gallopava]|uniref:Uncharacterized protein n=1 Tax=Verruconis gallopava TaxID=253628 RepID=A0A0D1Y1Y0_9PEZI|nr:uncharacterized protein PV09_00933 [Verruconis gallopava]KIW09041.1 hypothetical protein PV09_00933 [Verruconis gallopava]
MFSHNSSYSYAWPTSAVSSPFRTYHPATANTGMYNAALAAVSTVGAVQHTTADSLSSLPVDDAPSDAVNLLSLNLNLSSEGNDAIATVRSFRKPNVVKSLTIASNGEVKSIGAGNLSGTLRPESRGTPATSATAT